MRTSGVFLFLVVNVLALVRSDLWDVKVYTGNQPYAGTHANVYIRLHGNVSSSRAIYLDTPIDNHERGSVDSFPDKQTPYLGTLQKLDVWHDNTHRDPGWFLNKIIVTNQSSGRTYTFNCYRWLALDEDDHKISRTLTPS